VATKVRTFQTQNPVRVPFLHVPASPARYNKATLRIISTYLIWTTRSTAAQLLPPAATHTMQWPHVLAIALPSSSGSSSAATCLGVTSQKTCMSAITLRHVFIRSRWRYHN